MLWAFPCIGARRRPDFRFPHAMTLRTPFVFIAFEAISLAFSTPLSAATPPRITVTKDAMSKPAVSLAEIRADGSPDAQKFLRVLRNDLNRSGWFQVTDNPNAGIRVGGSVSGAAGISAALHVASPRGSGSWQRAGSSADVRAAAHAASDEIVRIATGRKGMASAPIIFVGKRGGGTDIYCCDADGEGVKKLTADGALCLSPTWLPGASGFLYTTFKRNFGEVFRADIAAGGIRPRPLATFPGLNNGAVASPDGRLAALVLSFTGNVELYVMNLQTRKLHRLTRTPHANEASPDWSPDGKTIAYVSDAGRSPQIHLLSPGGVGRRIVYNLQESVAPDWSSDGRIAFCGKSGGRYGIYVCGPTGAWTCVSPNDGANYEDPSWAPDDRHIVATRTAGGRRSLVVLDSMGDPWVQLLTVDGEWYLADWAK